MTNRGVVVPELYKKTELEVKKVVSKGHPWVEDRFYQKLINPIKIFWKHLGKYTSRFKTESVVSKKFSSKLWQKLPIAKNLGISNKYYLYN